VCGVTAKRHTPQPNKMLNKLINVLLVLSCSMVLVTGGVYLHNELISPPTVHLQVPPAALSVGKTLNIPQAAGKTTLVLGLSPTCPHCRANESIYRQLGGLPKIRSGKVQVLTVMIAKDQQSAQAFVDRDGIPGKLIVNTGSDKLSFPLYGTPTILLLSPEGKVLNVWDGELQGKEAKHFLATFN
jgi:hypothetical protein